MRGKLVMKSKRRTVTFRQVKVTVGMDAASKIEIRSGEITQVTIRKYAELKYRNLRHFNVASHVRLSAADAGRYHVQIDRDDLSGKAGKIACADGLYVACRASIWVRRYVKHVVVTYAGQARLVRAQGGDCGG